MKQSNAIALLIIAGVTATSAAQDVRRDRFGLEPGESRHMWENAQRAEQRRQEQFFKQQQQLFQDQPQFNLSGYGAPVVAGAPTAAPAVAPAAAADPSAPAGAAPAPAESIEGGAKWWWLAVAAASLVAIAGAWCVRQKFLQPGRASG